MADLNKPDFFALAKTVDIKDYVEDFYSIKFNANDKAICPFCGSSKTPAFSVSVKKQCVKCFSCMPKALGLTDFVMAMDKLNDHEAAKKICLNQGLITDNENSLTQDEHAKRAKDALEQREQLKKEREAKRAKEALEEVKKQKEAMVRMRKDAPVMLERFVHSPDIREQAKTILRWSNRLEAWYFDYIGYDEFHESIVIVNQSREANEVYNIKYQKKWEWDKESKRFIVGTRSAGKWLSEKHSTMMPFPIDYFKQHTDDRVVLSFGEKDALNLLSYDINTLTLGGVSNSFEPFKELLRNKKVYIWADNQLVEYIAAMVRYKELEDLAREIYIVSFFHINQTFPQKYDISDFIFDHDFTDKEQIFHAIEYSCFKLTNSFIEDVSNFFYGEKLLPRLDDFRVHAQKKQFRDIEKEILKVSKPVKSEMDQEINAAEMYLKQAKNSTLLGEFKAFLSQNQRDDAEPFVETFRMALDYKTRLFEQFRKHHEVDATVGFINDVKRSGYEIAVFRSNFYIWTGSHYQMIDREKDLETFIIQKWMSVAKVNMKQQTPDFMKKVLDGIYYRSVRLERYKEEQNYRVINFENGTGYLYDNGKFVFRNTHLKADAATNMLPFAYDKEATCPKWNRFLNEVLPDETEQNALMEFIGYCFLNSHKYQKFLFLLGSGANGKSVVLSVIKRFFGKDLTSNIDIQSLYSHEMVNIEGKYINVGSEINPKGLDKGQLENLKKITAGESVQLNHKNLKPYDIEGGTIPKQIFSGNKKVQGNLDGGLFRRMLYLNFNKTFDGKKRIQSLEDRFLDEMSGIFNLSMEGLNRLILQNDFSMSHNMKRNLDEYKEEADPILAYVNEIVTFDDTCMVPRKFLYAHYKKWTEERGHHSASDRTFFTRIRDIIPGIVDTQPSYNGKNHDILGNRPRFIENIRIDGMVIEDFFVDKNKIQTNDINIDKKFRLPLSIMQGANR